MKGGIFMTIRRNIPLEEFNIIISPPTNRLESMSINIYADGKFNMNGKLSEKLGSKSLEIRFSEDCRYICLLDNGNISFPKNGCKKIPEVVEILKKKNILFPAKYEMQYSDNTKSWQGVYTENPIKLPSEKVRSTKK